MKKRFVIIGGDAAGMSAASKIRRMQPESDIKVFEKGQHISFAACGMPYWISGVIEDGRKLQVLTPEKAREKRGLDVRTGHEVTSIDPSSQSIEIVNLETNEKFLEKYDSLLISTGARSVIPPIPGLENEGVFTLRNLADGYLIKEHIADKLVKHATIIGGGHIGLEMAEAFRHLDIDVTMLVRGDQVAPSIDFDILDPVTVNIRENGVDLQLETAVRNIEKNNDRLQVNTTGGQVVTDIIIVSTGVQPNAELAVDAGIAVGKSGAIRINENMQTNIENIYAAGDCAEHFHLVSGEYVWNVRATSANKGGRIAGENMAGAEARFPGVLGTAVAKVFDYTLAQTGLSEKQASQLKNKVAFETTTITAPNRAHYYPGSTPITIKLVVEKESKRLIGAQMLGTNDVAKRLDVFATAITAKMTVEEIGMLDLTYAPPFAPVYDPIHVAANVANK